MKMMRIKLLCILLVATLLMPSVAVADDPTVVITDYQVSPGVLMPGDIGIITITITNTATAATRTEVDKIVRVATTETTTRVTPINADIHSILLRGNGVEVITGHYRRLGELGPGQSITISFEIRAPARDGIHFPEVWIGVLGAENVRYPIPVKVDSSSVLLVADIPPAILVEESSELELSIANTRPNQISSVRIIPRAEGVEITPTEIFIGTMKPDEVRNITFELFSDSAGVKDIAFELIFRNCINNIHTEHLTLPIEVLNHPSVRLIAVGYPETVRMGDVIEIEFDVVNDRLSDVVGVRVIPTVENVRTIPSEVFIGSMEPDDVFSARFDIYTAGLPLGRNDIGFRVEFRDADGRFFESKVYIVSIDVIERMDEPAPIIPIVVTLLIVIGLVAGFFVYKRRQRNKRM